MMGWLLWKDYRQNCVAVYSAVFFMVIPHLLVLCVFCLRAWRGLHDASNEWSQCFAGATLYGFAFSQLSIAVIGGNAFSGERADRSAEFLFSLPISRSKILLSKLLVSLALILAIWLISFVILACLWTAHGEWRKPLSSELAEIWKTVSFTAAVSVTFFCVAWCLSSFVRSATVAALGGLVAPWFVMTGVLLTCYLLDIELGRSGEQTMALFKWVCLTMSPICFGLGTWHYLRRVEP